MTYTKEELSTIETRRLFVFNDASIVYIILINIVHQVIKMS
jgi:hypothetical protein